MRTFDAIVIGLGAAGSAACRTLAQRGLRVAGVDRFMPPHTHGSSHGQTRICRKAYFEHPSYIPLLERAYQAWTRLEQDSGRELFIRNGLILAGPPDSTLIRGVQHAATTHGLAIDDLAARDTHGRFSPFAIPDDWRVLYEADAGYLLVEQVIAAQLQLASAAHATLLYDQRVRAWRPDGSGYAVELADQTLRAERLVLAAGAWTATLLPDAALPLRTERRQQTWFQCDDPRLLPEVAPVFGFHVGDSFFYGFPQVTRGEIKLGEHLHGRHVAPDQVDHACDTDDLVRVRGFLREYLPGVAGGMLRHEACLYTLTPDEHFLVDRLPGHPGVAVATGFSGHGFKFAPLIGAALADLVTAGISEIPLDLFRWRFGTQPAG